MFWVFPEKKLLKSLGNLISLVIRSENGLTLVFGTSSDIAVAVLLDNNIRALLLLLFSFFLSFLLTFLTEWVSPFNEIESYFTEK